MAKLQQKVVAAIGLPIGNPWDVAMDPAGKFMYVTHYSSGVIKVTGWPVIVRLGGIAGSRYGFMSSHVIIQKA